MSIPDSIQDFVADSDRRVQVSLSLGTIVLIGLVAGGVYALLRNSYPDKPYEEWKRQELYRRAQEKEIEGRSTMNKEELIEALREN